MIQHKLVLCFSTPFNGCSTVEEMYTKRSEAKDRIEQIFLGKYLLTHDEWKLSTYYPISHLYRAWIERVEGEDE